MSSEYPQTGGSYRIVNDKFVRADEPEKVEKSASESPGDPAPKPDNTEAKK